MRHNWELVPEDPSKTGVSSDVRTYVCGRCGAGPLTVLAFDGKNGIRRAAKNLEIHMDCSVHIAKGVMES